MISSSSSCGLGTTLRTESVDERLVRTTLESKGLFIARQLVPRDYIEDMQKHWLPQFTHSTPAAPVIWGPFLGEPNQILFHEAETCCMFRSYDFLWNQPIHELTREVGIQLSRLRNRITESHPLAGETIESDRYGIYITTSYYPVDKGWMAEHKDMADSRRHWHFMLQLTFKGNAYTEGGLILTDKQGKRIDVDSEVTPGDVIFFDGSCQHGVELIRGGNGVGRIQMFSIPTFMESPEQNDRMLENVSIIRFLKAKLRPLKFRLINHYSRARKAS